MVLLYSLQVNYKSLGTKEQKGTVSLYYHLRDPFEKYVCLIPPLGIVGLKTLLLEDIIKFSLHFNLTFIWSLWAPCAKRPVGKGKNHYPGKSNCP